jgi:hypothetical protein
VGKKRRTIVTEAPQPLTIDRAPAVIFRRESSLESPSFTRGGGNASERLVLGVDVVYACVRTIADAVSGAQVNEWRGTDPLPPSRLTRRPMQRLTMREWLWKVASTLALYNVCPLISRGGEDSEGVPWSVVPVSPPRLQWPADGQPLLDGTPISPDSIRLIRRAMFPSLTMEQASLLRLAQDTFMAADAAQSYTGDWWEAGGAPLITLSTDQDMTREQMDAMRERWMELRALGSSVPAILARGVKAETFGADLGTQQSDNALEAMGSSIARYFGVPPAMVNVRSAYGSMTYSTTEAQGITFARYTLEPYAGAIGDALSDYLPGDYQVGRRISLDLSHLTRAEQGARYAAYESGVRAGWLTPDEVRKAEGYALLGSATIATGPPADPTAEEPSAVEVNA